ncbi:MAG TPA: threonine/serine dehydratase [Azospirillaceae bacterium]|nr:threonine/serine dehydratase [Azospirillaceae bacterium]
MPLPTFDDVRAAAERLQGHAVRTPLLESIAANRLLGGRLLLKAECLQQTGSFKFRGAYNRLVQLSAAERARGVVAFSSGNHGQAVAAAGRLLGAPATVIMPSDAPAVKIEATRGHGADIVLYDRFTEKREAIAARYVEERGATLVPPFDDPHIIAGQGTVGLEIAEQAAERGIRLDEVLVCAGGGGLVAGSSLALKTLSPDTLVWAAEPRAVNDWERSLAAGERLGNDPQARSICDALLTPMPGEITFPININTLAGGVSATDEEALRAMAFAFRHFRIVLEPGGAIALACALAGRRPVQGRTIAVVCSGGNVDRDLFRQALADNPDL